MPSFCVIIYLCIFEDFRLRIFCIFEDTVLKQFCFKAAETGFHKRIAVWIISPAMLCCISFERISFLNVLPAY